MIDKKQLKELGWSDELISEVTRTSESFKDMRADQIRIEEVAEEDSIESGSSIYFTVSEISSSANIYVSELE